MDLNTVLKSSKLINLKVESLIRNTEIVTLMDGNTPIYDLPKSLLEVETPIEEDTETESTINYQGILLKIKYVLKGSKYRAIYEIINSQDNEEIVSFIKENLNQEKDVTFTTPVFLNVEIEQVNDGVTSTGYSMLEKNMTISGKFRITFWNVFPKVTNMTFNNPNTLKFLIEGIMDKVQIDL